MKTSSALLALCVGNSPPVTGEFPSQRPVARSFGVFFDLCLNKRLNKQSRRRWFETPSRSLWRHWNACFYTWTLCVCVYVIFEQSRKHSYPNQYIPSRNNAHSMQETRLVFTGHCASNPFTTSFRQYSHGECIRETRDMDRCLWRDVTMTVKAPQITCTRLSVQPFG